MKLPTLSIFFALALLFAMMQGCIGARSASTEPVKTILPQRVPANLQGASKSMDWIVVIAVMGIGIGIAAYFAIPGDHKLAFGVIFGSVAMGLTALMVQTSLPFLPWIFMGCAVLGIIWLVARVLRKPAEVKA